MRSLKSDRRFEVSLTAAFLTGEPLRVRVSEYDQLQRTLGQELELKGGGWGYESAKWRDVGSYDTGGGYSSLVPLVIVRREGEGLRAAAEAALRDCSEAERRWLSESTAGWTWSLRSIAIDVYDLGVGVIRGTYEVGLPSSVGIAAARRTIESLSWLRPDPERGVRSALVESYERLTRETAEVFSRAVRKCASSAREEPWLAPLLDALPPAPRGGPEEAPASREPGGDEWGRLLWMHPVYVVRTWDRAPTWQVRRVARSFRAAYYTTATFPQGLFVPGIDSSAVVIAGAAPTDEQVPMKLIGLMWAYYALFMEMDRGLLATLDSDRWSAAESLRGLEHEADRAFRVGMRVEEARARLDSALTDLGGGELSLWNAISDVAKFGDLVAAVEAKVTTLQRIAERRVEQAATTRARRTNSVLSALTALTVVTVAIAILTNFIGSRADAIGHIQLRALIIAVAFALAAMLYLAAHRDLPWRPRLRRPRARPLRRARVWARSPRRRLELPRPPRRGPRPRPRQSPAALASSPEPVEPASVR
ncbi:MAG: hypothetical protein ACJ760_05450 [Thermoleophilaceae bacterium]